MNNLNFYTTFTFHDSSVSFPSLLAVRPSGPYCLYPTLTLAVNNLHLHHQLIRCSSDHLMPNCCFAYFAVCVCSLCSIVAKPVLVSLPRVLYPAPKSLPQKQAETIFTDHNFKSSPESRESRRPFFASNQAAGADCRIEHVHSQMIWRSQVNPGVSQEIHAHARF